MNLSNMNIFPPSVHLNDLKAVSVVGIVVGIVVVGIVGVYHKYSRIV
jgi:hypothetical protein